MFKHGYCFDDVLLIPKHSNVSSRSTVDLSIKLPRGLSLDLPIVSANMRNVTEVEMARVVKSSGGMAILHRFDSPQNLLSMFEKANEIEGSGLIGCSVGVKPYDIELAKDFIDSGCKVICVDVAHGDHSNVVDFLTKLRNQSESILIIAGNVVTHTGANRLWEAGADIIKIGVGSGSICSTRIETGNGYPQLSALQEVTYGEYDYRDGIQEPPRWPMFIADGGIRSGGDCVKALCFTDLVMIGNIFAGTDEAPGKIVTINKQQYKEYAGSSTHKQKHVEGVVGLVPCKGSVSHIITKLVEGIKSGCSYQGVQSVELLQQDPQFVVISNAGITESKPHSVKL